MGLQKLPPAPDPEVIFKKIREKNMAKKLETILGQSMRWVGDYLENEARPSEEELVDALEKVQFPANRPPDSFTVQDFETLNELLKNEEKMQEVAQFLKVFGKYLQAKAM